jgi:Putative transposase, YhgA-like
MFEKFIGVKTPHLYNSSLIKYRALLKDLSGFFKSKAAEDITETEVVGFRTWLSDTRRLAPVTVKDKLYLAASAWNWAIEDALLPADHRNPWSKLAASQKVPPKQRPKPFSVEEVRAIIVGFRTDPEYSFYVDFVEFLLGVGCRTGEAVALYLEAIHGSSRRAEFIELFLPEVAEYLDADGIEFLGQEYFADTTTGERRKIDILAKVKFRGQDTGFLMHIENQSYDQDTLDRRMLFYFTRLYQKFLLPIYPIVVFSFDYPLKVQSNQHIVAFPDRKVLEFNFATIQLNQLHWRDFLKQHNPVAAALMSKMRIARKDRPKVKAECLRLLATLQLDPARTELISGFVDTYLKLNPQEEPIFQEEIDRMGLAEQEQVMEIVTTWMERGMERGAERETVLSCCYNWRGNSRP